MSSALLILEAVPNAAARAHQRGTWLLSRPDREVGADGSVGRVPLLLVVAGYTHLRNFREQSTLRNFREQST